MASELAVGSVSGLFIWSVESLKLLGTTEKFRFKSELQVLLFLAFSSCFMQMIDPNFYHRLFTVSNLHVWNVRQVIQLHKH